MKNSSVTKKESCSWRTHVGRIFGQFFLSLAVYLFQSNYEDVALERIP
jgi:hypothetical protein